MINDNEISSPLQQLLIGAGTLLVVALVIIAAIFLTVQDQNQEDVAISGAQTGSTTTEGGSPAVPVATSTFTPTASPTATPPPIDTPEPLPSSSPPPTQVPTATATAKPSPTFTATPARVAASPTSVPTPAATTNCGTPPPEGWVAYQVQTGDTFNSLATRTGISVFTLQQSNCLSGNLPAGQILYLPFSALTLSPTSIPFVPMITSISPAQVDEDYSNQIIVTIIGKNFLTTAPGFRVELRGPQNVLLTRHSPGSNTSFEAIMPANLPSGSYEVVVTNPDGRAAVKPYFGHLNWNDSQRQY